MTTTDLVSLREAYSLNVEDWALLLVIADAHLDVGDESGAACLRWMSTNRRRPYHNMKGVWTWTWCHDGIIDQYEVPSALPMAMFTRESNPDLSLLDKNRRYANAPLALDAVLKAWKVAPQKMKRKK